MFSEISSLHLIGLLCQTKTAGIVILVFVTILK